MHAETHIVNGLEAGGVLCVPCEHGAHLFGCVSLGLLTFKCFTRKRGKRRKERQERGSLTPRHPIPFRLCCYFPNDLCHLAADLNFGTSSMWNASTRGRSSHRNENEMICASLLIPVSALSSAQSHHPLLPLCIIILLLHPLIPPTSLTLLLTLLPPPLGNQCALSFRGTRRHIDLAARTHAHGHHLHTHTHTRVVTHTYTHTHTHTHTHTYIDLARRSSSIGTAKQPFFSASLCGSLYCKKLSLSHTHTHTHTHTPTQQCNTCTHSSFTHTHPGTYVCQLKRIHRVNKLAYNMHNICKHPSL